MTQRTVSGTLRQLGPSKIEKQVVDYSYLEIDEEILKKVCTFEGLHGKLQTALGEQITLHMDGPVVIAITCADGRTYCAERFGIFLHLCLGIILMIGLASLLTGLYVLAANREPSQHFCEFIFFGGIGFVFLRGAYKANQLLQRARMGNYLPNAIPIPRS